MAKSFLKKFFNQEALVKGGVVAFIYWLSTQIPKMTANPNWQLVWTLVFVIVGVHVITYKK